MAYEPKEWQCGEVVTADALNHLEQGVADSASIFVVNFNDDGGTWVADKAWSDAEQAIKSGIPTVGVVKKNGYPPSYYTMPLMQEMNFITGEYLTTTTISSGSTLHTHRIDWMSDGQIIFEDTNYTLQAQA